MRSPIENQLAYHAEACRMRRLAEGRPLDESFQLYLRQRFPHRVTVSLACGPGWGDLIEALCEILDAWGAAISLQDVKEKYGQIRISYFGDDQNGRVEELVEAAEEISSMICEVCGARAMLRSCGGWLSTTCDQHAPGGSTVVRAKSEGWL